MFKGGMPNIQNVMKQMKAMQEKVEQAQAELEKKTVQGEAGGGMVKVTANGKQRIVKIEIENEVINSSDKEMLEDLITAATNQALEKAHALSEEEMQKATAGMMPNIPGMKLPGF